MNTSLFIGIQSRLNSSRYPNKAFVTINEIPLINRVIDRIKQIDYESKIALLVPESEISLYQRFLDEYDIQIPIFGGSENDVLDRYVQASRYFGAEDLIMRVTGDNPLISIVLAEKLLNFPVTYDLAHYIKNPLGTGVELITRLALEKSHTESNDTYEREHVTQYIYRNPDKFTIFEPITPYKYEGDEHFSLDYPQDLFFLENFIKLNPEWDLDKV